MVVTSLRTKNEADMSKVIKLSPGQKDRQTCAKPLHIRPEGSRKRSVSLFREATFQNRN